MKRCPKCRELLLPGSKKCGDCGWQEKKQEPVYVDDHKCEWRSGGVQCPAMGTLSDSIKGGGPWYFRWHYFNMNDFEYCRQITDDMTQNGIPKTDWREEAIKNREAK